MRRATVEQSASKQEIRSLLLRRCLDRHVSRVECVFFKQCAVFVHGAHFKEAIMSIRQRCARCGKRATDDSGRAVFEPREYILKRPRYVEYKILLCPECSKDMEQGPRSMAAFASYWTEGKHKVGV